jgi:glycosyltransferase involved in cell wall biosynthesis
MQKGKTYSAERTIAVVIADALLDKVHGASILGLFRSLASRGYKVRIWLPSHIARSIRDGPVTIVAVKSGRNVPFLGIMLLLVRYYRHVISSKPDLVIFDSTTAPLFVLLRLLLKTKGIMLNLSRPVAYHGIKGWLRFTNFRLSLIVTELFASAFTAISPFEALYFSRLGRIPESKMIVVPSPLGEGFEKFDTADVNINAVRSKLHIDTLQRKVIVLYHGILDEHRGIMQLVRLFAESFRDDDQVVLLLAGDGPATESVRKFIRQNGIDNMILLGGVPYAKMPELVAACNVGLVALPDHPWWRYQVPTKLIEFLALHKPVIVSDLPGIRWMAGDTKLVVYLKKWTACDLRRALGEARAKTNVEVSHEICKYFTSRSIADELSRVIESVCQR